MKPDYESIGRAVWHYYRKRALARVARAIKNGDLQRPETSACHYCGGPALIYEHRDYALPLEVVPACDRCNHSKGSASLNIEQIIEAIRHSERMFLRA